MPPAALPDAGLATRPVEYVTHAEIRPDAGSLTVRTTLRFPASPATGDSLVLLLNQGLVVEGASGGSLISHRVRPSELAPIWNEVVIHLREGSARQPVDVTLEYAGTPVFPEDGINRITSDLVELNLDSQWHPIVATFDREMMGMLRVDLPDGWQVVASGETRVEGTAVVVENHVPQVDVAFIAAPGFQRVVDASFTVHHRGADPLEIRSALDAAEACRAHLDPLYGGREPLPPGKLVLTSRDGPGYARKNYIVFSRIDVRDSIGLHQYVCHELAHFWTTSAGAFTPDHWMVEAFAEYFAARFIRERFGAAAFRQLVAQWEEMGRTRGPVWTPEATSRPTFFAMYRRAPWILARLEERIGQATFERFAATYTAERIRTTERLLERLHDIAGAGAAEWLRAELAAP